MRTYLAHALAAVTAVAAPVALAPRPARACGGMVFPEHAARVGGMSQQELLVAFTPERTVLLASVGYEGATGAPAFILPLPAAPTEVTQADPAVLVALDELTAPEVTVTVIDDDHGGGGLCGSAGSLKDGGGGLGDDRGDVMVLQRGATADYDYVLVGGATGDTIGAWLDAEGYTLPADYAAALDPYVAGGDVIFAAKLKSTAPSGALAPIELHLPPTEPGAFSIPFGLAAQSLPPDQGLTITTYLLAAGGLAPANYPAAPIDQADLVAYNAIDTNYADLYAEATTAGSWVIDASLGDFSQDTLVSALDTAIDAGRADPDDRDAVATFAAHIDLPGARLTRLRTTLSADQLHDMTLKKVAGEDQSRSLYVTRDESSSAACAVAPRRGVPLAVLLVPLLLLLRRRR